MSHNIGGMAPFVSMPRGRNQMYYSQCPGGEPPPHMQRGPCFPDDKMNCGMGGMNEFKPPMMSNPEPPPPKKKRRTSNNTAANPPPPPVMQDLLPPPLTGYGDTIVASNPFDDTPPQQQTSVMNLNHMQHHGMSHHMASRHMPCSPHMIHMGGPGHCQMGGSPINCGPPMGSPMGPMSCGGMSNCGPMNCGPGMGSPIGPNRSPLVCPPGGGMMSCGPPQSSPMNHPMNRSPSVGSPLGPVMNAISGPSTGSPMDCGKGSPMQGVGQHGMSCASPMGSPIPNGPMGNNSCVGPPISSPMGSTCGMGEMGGGVMNRSPMNGPMGSPMCGMGGPSPHMNNTNTMTSDNSMNMNPSAVGKGLNNGPPVSISAGAPVNSNGPMRGQMINHHPGNMIHGMHPMQMGHPHNYPGPKPMPVSAGKVYPADQPMVFNPQNPNAPPIYPCGICHKEVHDNDQAILCESGCNFWFHRVCTGLTEAAYQLLTAEVYAEWVCDKCLASKNIPLVKFKP